MIKIKSGRTNTYRATVEMKDGEPTNDGGFVEALRKSVIEENKNSDRTHYVKLQGRGPRKKYGRGYNISLPLGYAEYADVYVYERYQWN